MTIDMTKAVKGATVHFRCGGSAKVSNIQADKHPLAGLRYITGIEDGGVYFYQESGLYSGDGLSPFDIIRIDPPAFDWATVRTGMCFRESGGDRDLYYIGTNPTSVDQIILKSSANNFYWGKRDKFTRIPEYDIEVPA